jgi:hypothetical protein
MDGTFKTVPKIFFQLLTIGFVENNCFWSSRKRVAQQENINDVDDGAAVPR